MAWRVRFGAWLPQPALTHYARKRLPAEKDRAQKAILLRAQILVTELDRTSVRLAPRGLLR